MTNWPLVGRIVGFCSGLNEPCDKNLAAAAKLCAREVLVQELLAFVDIVVNADRAVRFCDTVRGFPEFEVSNLMASQVVALRVAAQRVREATP